LEKKERKMATTKYADSYAAKAFQELKEKYKREMGVKNPYNPSAPFGGGYIPTTGTVRPDDVIPDENPTTVRSSPPWDKPVSEYIATGKQVELVEKEELDAALGRITSLESQLENVLKMQAKMVERLCKIEGARD
jgi:hypothetical protein